MLEEKKGFICVTAWECEIGETDVTVYESLSALEDDHGTGCGVVEIRMRAHRNAKTEPKLSKQLKPAQFSKRMLHSAKRQLRSWKAYVARLKREAE